VTPVEDPAARVGALMQNRLLYILLAWCRDIDRPRERLHGERGQLSIKSIGGEIVDSNYQPDCIFAFRWSTK